MSTTASPPAGRVSLTVAAVALGIVLAAAFALWGYHGTAVFYEVILAGIAACF